MPTIQVLTPPEAADEPVSLALACVQCALDLDAAVLARYAAGEDTSGDDPAVIGQLELLSLFRSAAREKVEGYTGRYFAPQTLELTYELGEPYKLPSGATADAVSGFFTSLEDLEEATAWVEEYRKGISISRELSWGAAQSQTYTVTATTTGDTAYASLAKRAILEITAEWWRNRETTVAGVAVISELPVSWRVTLAQAVVHPIGY